MEKNNLDIEINNLEKPTSDDNSFNDDFDLNDDFGQDGQSPLTKHSDLLKELTNFDPYLKEMVNNWLGLYWSENEGKYIRNPLVSPVMSIQGATWCLGLLKTYARSNNIITDISQTDYKNILGDHIEAIWLNLGTRLELGIKDEGDLIRIGNELEHAAALVLMGAGDGKYNSFLGTSMTRHETVQTGIPLSNNNQIIQTKKLNILEKAKQAILGNS